MKESKYTGYECYVVLGKKTHRLFELHIHVAENDTNCINLLKSFGKIKTDDKQKEKYLKMILND